MDDDKTVLRPRKANRDRMDGGQTQMVPAETLRVSLLDAQGKCVGIFSFLNDFTVGRALDNAVVVPGNLVSRHHLAIRREDGDWWAHDLNSMNGVYVRGKRVEGRTKLHLPALLSLGTSGFQLDIHRTGGGTETSGDGETVYGGAVAPASEPGTFRQTGADIRISPEQVKARLLAEGEVEDAGDFTRIVRRLIREDRSVRRRTYRKLVWSLALLLSVSAGLLVYQQVALSSARALAIDMFYDIKLLEVSLSQADIRLEESARVLEETIQAVAGEKLRVEQDRIRAEQQKIAAEKKRLASEAEKLKTMKARYQQYVKEANALKLAFPTAAHYEAELIGRVARGFGESELELPEGFVAEVRKYIRYWQHSPRMQRAIDSLEKNDYAPIVISALEQEDLPLHLIYLPLQESNYDTQAIGPETRFGIAKGAWQFLATTAREYGLSPGPLADTREYDEQDSRFDFKLATRAGTKYLKHIYGTEAQASGLLVVASYNYGHNRVREMIRSMPDNPRDRNFWKFIQQYEIPKETYDYVFYIFSAAVIGEDPSHFGFKFKPPLLASK